MTSSAEGPCIVLHRAIKNAGDFLIRDRSLRLLAAHRPDLTVLPGQGWKPAPRPVRRRDARLREGDRDQRRPGLPAQHVSRRVPARSARGDPSARVPDGARQLWLPRDAGRVGVRAGVRALPALGRRARRPPRRPRRHERTPRRGPRADGDDDRRPGLVRPGLAGPRGLLPGRRPGRVHAAGQPAVPRPGPPAAPGAGPRLRSRAGRRRVPSRRAGQLRPGGARRWASRPRTSPTGRRGSRRSTTSASTWATGCTPTCTA